MIRVQSWYCDGRNLIVKPRKQCKAQRRIEQNLQFALHLSFGRTDWGSTGRHKMINRSCLRIAVLLVACDKLGFWDVYDQLFSCPASIRRLSSAAVCPSSRLYPARAPWCGRIRLVCLQPQSLYPGRLRRLSDTWGDARTGGVRWLAEWAHESGPGLAARCHQRVGDALHLHRGFYRRRHRARQRQPQNRFPSPPGLAGAAGKSA